MADLGAEEVGRLQTQQYWDERYAEEENETFDWFRADFVLPFVLEHLGAHSAAIVMLGCGNSSLSRDLYAAGYLDIANVDFSRVCIEQMQRLHSDMPRLTWHVMDVREMGFSDESFDVAIDKGTLDAFLSYKGSVWEIPDEVKQPALQYMDEVYRILKKGGTFIYITYRQPHFARLIIDRPYWQLTTHKLSTGAGTFDYFGYVMIKH